MTQHMQGCIKLFSDFSSMDSYRFAPYTSSNKYPGWIADTFRTWSKLMPWLYSCLRLQCFNFKEYLPEGALNQWKKEECIKFLNTRKISFNSSHNVQQLRRRITRIIKANNNKIPTQKRSELQTIKSTEISRLIWYCHIMFRNFFDTENAWDIAQHTIVTKQFLSSIHSITTRLYKDDSFFYIRKYNFVSLLRAMIDGKQKWTSGRYIHEGGIEGEGMVKELRPLLPNVLQSMFAKNLIQNKYAKDTVTAFLSILDRQNYNYKQPTFTDQYIALMYHKIKVYDSKSIIIEYMSLGAPINIAISHERGAEDQIIFGPLFINDNHVCLLPMKIEKSFNHVKEFTYHYVTAKSHIILCYHFTCGLMLPELALITKDVEMKYAIVPTEIMQLNSEKKFV